MKTSNGVDYVTCRKVNNIILLRIVFKTFPFSLGYQLVNNNFIMIQKI